MTDLTRASVNLNRRAADALDALTGSIGCGKTDAIQRALVAYAYLDREVRSGAEVRLHYPATGRVEVVTFL